MSPGHPPETGLFKRQSDGYGSRPHAALSDRPARLFFIGGLPNNLPKLQNLIQHLQNSEMTALGVDRQNYRLGNAHAYVDHSLGGSVGSQCARSASI
jgi:hypothetical protein